MIIAVRSASGTTRIDIPNDSVVKDILATLRQKGINIDNGFITTSPSGQPLSVGSALTSSGIKNGDLIYLKSNESNSNNKSNNSTLNSNSNNNNNNNNDKVTSPSTTTITTKEGERNINCKHAPQDKCVFCSDAAGEKKCEHPENMTCPNCQSKKFKGTRLKWLCKHGPNTKCSNCLKVPKSVEYKCNHGPQSKCVNCIGKEETEDNDNNNNNNNNNNKQEFSPKIKKDETPIKKCNHGPKTKCTNCLPKDDPNSTEIPQRKCKNHGIHGSCIECIEWRESLKMKLKAQDNPVCPGVKVDFQSANVFQQYLQSKKKEKIQRVGFVYGNFMDDKSVVADVIYEPPQTMSEDGTTVELLEDPMGEKIESLTAMLGLTRVGWIFSHPQRKYVMSSKEILQIAQFQNKYGPSFVTLILSINSEGQSNLEAFQVSDQALKLEKTGEFSPIQTNPLKCKLKSPVFEEGVETVNADNNFFIVTVPVKAREDKSIFHQQFPVENRDPGPSYNDLTNYHLEGHSPLQFFSDFHFLVFLLNVNFLDISMFPGICEGILTKDPSNLTFIAEIVGDRVSDLLK